MFSQNLVETSAAPTADEPFLAFAWTQESRIDQLLSAGEHSLWFRRRKARRVASRAGVMWSDDITDPEFRKNLRIVRRLIGETIALYQRTRYLVSYQSSSLPKPLELEVRIGEVQERIELPTQEALTLKVFLGYRFTLERLLVELGDRHYLMNRAAELYSESEGTVVTWQQLYPNMPPPIWAAGPRADDEAIAATRQMVGQLLAAKEASDLPIRARRELKQRALIGVALTFLLATILLGRAMREALIGPVVLPAVAGVAGAALGMLIKLRDELRRGAQIREFLPIALAQLIVGATAGLFVSLISGFPLLPILSVAGARGVAAVSFVAGFSEAAFLGLIGRIAAEAQPKA